MAATDCIVVGGGIVGAACARELARAGASVDLLEAGHLGGGATAAGMGHLVTMDGVPGELALTRHGVDAWRRESDALKRSAEYTPTGTLWIASTAAEVELLERQHRAFATVDFDAELLTRAQLAAVEPALSAAAYAGLRVPGDAIVYAPKAAQWLAQQSCGGRLRVHHGAHVVRVGPDWAQAADGRRFEAAQVVVACGLAARELLPGLALVARRGHLLITDRYPRTLRHHMLEVGYAASTHADDAVSVSFNVQPRPSGQILIGSSREPGVEHAAEDAAIVRRLAARALHFLPGLDAASVLRVWTGVRAVSPSGLPIIGRAPLPGAQGRVWVAAGHEGLGVTTALVSAALLRAKMFGGSLPAGLEPFYAEDAT